MKLPLTAPKDANAAVHHQAVDNASGHACVMLIHHSWNTLSSTRSGLACIKLHGKSRVNRVPGSKQGTRHA